MQKQLVLMVQEFFPESPTVPHFGAIAYRANEVMESHVDLSRLKALGWTSRVALTAGLGKTIEAEKLGKQGRC